MKNTATVADDERAMFHNWYRTEAEAMPVGAMMAWMARAAIAHAAPVGADVAASSIDTPCFHNLLAGFQAAYMLRDTSTITNFGESETTYADVVAHVDSFIRTALAAGAPVETVKPATFAPGTIVRKKSGSQWQGAIVGTYSTALTPEGYAVESSTHRGSVQIYPVSALELVTKGNV